ncbi:MAG: hypothetical protein AAF567_09995 [Actinomycetota bacterium]
MSTTTETANRIIQTVFVAAILLLAITLAAGIGDGQTRALLVSGWVMLAISSVAGIAAMLSLAGAAHDLGTQFERRASEVLSSTQIRLTWGTQVGAFVAAVATLSVASL